MKRTSSTLLPIVCLAGVTTVLCCLHSCKQDDRGTEQAQALLEQSRVALASGDFTTSYNLLDSLRQAFPRAVDVRRAALLFEDTIRLEEAKVEAAAMDSIYTFACLDREELRATGIDTLSARFKLLRDRADSLRYAVDRAHKKVQFFERKIQEAQTPQL